MRRGQCVQRSMQGVGRAVAMIGESEQMGDGGEVCGCCKSQNFVTLRPLQPPAVIHDWMPRRPTIQPSVTPAQLKSVSS